MTNNLIENKIKADRWDKLVKLTGHYQNGTNVTVKLFQDECTRAYNIEVNGICNYGRSFEEALHKFEVEDD